MCDCILVLAVNLNVFPLFPLSDGVACVIKLTVESCINFYDRSARCCCDM